MGIIINIKRNIGTFKLNLFFESEKRRIGILGASGCGKSMTLQCIAGICTPDSGLIKVGERTLFDSATKTNEKVKNRKVGYLFQNYALFPTMTVCENIMTGIALPRKKRLQKAEEMIRRFSLEGLSGRLPGELSGGQQQRTAMARMLASEPDIILLDEPFSALDSHLKEQMQLELEYMLNDYEGTVVMVSHSRDEIYRFTDDVIVMEAGRQSETGDTKEVFAHPRTKAGARLTGCKNISKIEPAGDRLVHALDWDMVLETNEAVSDRVKYIGIRAHEIMSATGEEKNVKTLKIMHKTVLPFEMQYLLQNEKEAEKLIWKLPRNLQNEMYETEDMVKVLLPKEKLLLLEE